LRPRDTVFHMDGCRVARQKYFPNDLQTSLKINTCAHDDVVNVRLGKRGPYIIDSSAAKELDT
jgi:hypothetical protein